MNQNPRVPKPPKQRKSRITATCTVIALCGVLLSGLAGYGGYKLAASQNTSSTTVINSDTYTPTVTSTSSSNTVEVLDVSDVVSSLRPSVVEIKTEIVSSSYYPFYGEQSSIAEGAGSGVIISEDGYIVTNNHVIEDASSIEVTTYDGQTFDATLVGTDEQTDIAVLKADVTGLIPASFGDSDALEVGEAVIAIGNPLGSLGGTVTTGIVSAVAREITINDETMTLIQTDAAINSGNSGGGLFDINGSLIGIVNAKSSGTGIEGLGFAIPISDVTAVIQDLIDNGKVTSRPVLGVSLQNVSGSYSEQTPDGVYIVQIVDGGSAANAGLEYGDRIVSMDGTEVSTASEVKQILRQHAIGDTITITIQRNGQTQDVSVTLQGSSN